MAEPDDVQAFLSDRLEKFTLLTMETLAKPCTDDNALLTNIASKFDTWETTYAYLDITRHELDDIKKDNSQQRLKKKAVLDMWVAKSGVDATYLCLIKALYKGNNKDMIDEILRILQEAHVAHDQDVDYESGLDSEPGDALTDKEVSFLCGCEEKCSLDKFLTIGCPCPTENKEYPLLNIKEISKKDKANLIAKLELDAEQIRRNFGRLTRSMTESLRKKCNESSEMSLVEDLKIFVISMQPFRYMTPEEGKFKMEILQSKTVGEFMATLLNNFASWFNHSLLSCISEEFDVCADEYKQYVSKKLDDFLKKSLFEIPRNSFGEPKRTGQFILKIDVPPPNHGVEASILPLLKSHVSKRLGITASSFNLCTYKEGCIEIVVGAPALLLEAAFPLDEEQLVDIGNIESTAIKIVSVIYNQKKYDIKSSPTKPQVHDSGVTLTNVEQQFSSLVVEVSRLPLEKLKTALDNLSTHTMTGMESEPFFTNDVSEVTAASSTFNLILALSSYWSLVNYLLLEYLLLYASSDTSSVNSKISEYVADLSSLKITHLPALLHPVDPMHPFSTVPIVVRMTPQYIQNKTVFDLLCVIKAIAKALDLEPQSVLLKSYDKRKLELQIYLPVAAIESIVLSFESTRFNQLSEQHSIVQISFKDSIIFQVVSNCKLVKKSNAEHLRNDLNIVAESLQEQGTTENVSSTTQLQPIEAKITAFKDKLIEYKQATSNDQKASAATNLPITTKIITKADSTMPAIKEMCYNKPTILTRPMPKNSDKFRGKFVLCWNRSNCKNKQCTFAHSIEERDAWNKEKFSILNEGTDAIQEVDKEPAKVQNIPTHIPPIQNADYQKGVLEICEVCFVAGYSYWELANKICLKPFQHDLSYAERFHAAWDHKNSTLVPINPRPPTERKRAGNTPFSLCEKGTFCNKAERCLKPHSEIERDAWNYDLAQVAPALSVHEKPLLSRDEYSLTKMKVPALQSTSTTIQRQDWSVNYKTRLKKSLARNEKVVDKELTLFNYGEKFHHSICAEEQKHMDLLAEKCDGEYWFRFGPAIPGGKIAGYIKGMTQDQLHYAAQASSGVFFVDSRTNQDICESDISMKNYRSFEWDFEVEMHASDSKNLRQSFEQGGKSNGREYIATVQFDLKHSYFETLLRAVSNLSVSGLSKILLQDKSEKPEEAINIKSACLFKQLDIDESYQLDALHGIMQLPSTLPIVISGPFGSGKTRVIARAVYETIQKSFKDNKKTRILVCAHHSDTNKTYAEHYFIPAFKTQLEEGKIAIIRIDRSRFVSNMTKNMFVRTMSTFDFRRYVSSGSYNRPQCVVVIATYMSSINIGESLVSKQHHFTHVFLDEAAQAREPEAIGSLSAINADTKLVVAGDSKQVGPYVVVLIEDEILKTSILERLERAYTNDRRLKKWHFKLEKNYRCHPVVTRFLSKVMYDSPVGVNDDPDHTNVKCPMVFHCSDVSKSASSVSGFEKILHEETDEVIKQAKTYLRQHQQIPCKDCCIISSNRSQLNLIRMKLKDHYSIENIKLLPSFSIQGHEFKAIFLCTSDYKDESGLISNHTKSLVTPRIFNTVLSRSRSLVVAVGNPFTLLEFGQHVTEQINCWKEFIKRCLSRTEGYLMTFAKGSNQLEIKKSLARQIGITLPSDEEQINFDSSSRYDSVQGAGHISNCTTISRSGGTNPPEAAPFAQKYHRRSQDRVSSTIHQPSRSRSDNTGYHYVERTRFPKSHRNSTQNEYTRHQSYD